MKRGVPKLSDLNRREKLLALGSVLVMAIVVLDSFVLGPWIKHNWRVRQESQNLEGRIENTQRLLSRRSQILSEVEAYQEHLKWISESQTELAALLRELETLGKESGVSLGEIKPLTPVSEGAYKNFSFDVNLTATLEQWIRFVHLVQTSAWMFEVDRATMEVKSDESNLLSSTFRVTKKMIPLESSA